MTLSLTRVDQLVQATAEQEQLFGPKKLNSSLDFNSELLSLHQKLNLLSVKFMKAINKLKLSTIENNNKRFHNNFKNCKKKQK